MRKQLQALRDRMAEHDLQAYLIPTADPHGSEYVGGHFACREYISGFTGSAGTLLVFPNWAGLWTDGRYFLQAEQQLQDSGIRLMKSGEAGVPTLEAFLKKSLRPEQTLGFDGRCVDAHTGRRYYKLCKQLGAKLDSQLDLVGELWTDRPPRSCEPVWALPQAGESRRDKLARVREAMARQKAGLFLLSTLEDIAWVLNLRGGDLACTPVFLAYLAVGQNSCTLFAQTSAFPAEVLEALEEDEVFLRPYESFYPYLGRLPQDQRVLLDTRRVNTTLLTSIPPSLKVVDRPNPTIAMKAVKNPVEQANARKAHRSDGIALTRFMYWIKTQAGKQPITERSAAAKLEALRKEDPDYLQPSFDPILAYGPHGAIVHYSATQDSNAAIQAEGFLLADTGGHYRTGTTDCTRTYALGPLTAEQKTHYTAVLRGNLALAAARFKHGAAGLNLDYLARAPLWALGLDFNHGTGHGVGHLLSVHEGPQGIRARPLAGSRREAVLEAGMITSDEPGLYLDGQYGIRLENLLLCVEAQTTTFGRFLAFETLTLTPFDLDAVDPEQLQPHEKAQLNAYHAAVRAALTPHLSPEEAAWLAQATAPLP